MKTKRIILIVFVLLIIGAVFTASFTNNSTITASAYYLNSSTTISNNTSTYYRSSVVIGYTDIDLSLTLWKRDNQPITSYINRIGFYTCSNSRADYRIGGQYEYISINDTSTEFGLEQSGIEYTPISKPNNFGNVVLLSLYFNVVYELDDSINNIFRRDIDIYFEATNSVNTTIYGKQRIRLSLTPDTLVGTYGVVFAYQPTSVEPFTIITPSEIYSKPYSSFVLSSNSPYEYAYTKFFDNLTSNINYENGYTDGYSIGHNDGLHSSLSYSWLIKILDTVGSFLSLEIFPNIRLIYLVGIPLLLSVFLLILKLARG